MVDSRNIPNTTNKITSKQKNQHCLDNNWGNTFSYFSYGIIGILLSTIASESLAVDLGRFGKGVVDPLVKFATDYWVYGAGLGGIFTAILSEGDGRVRVVRGGTVFVGSSAICMGILATIA
ncbi:hypothetical protein [Candidatus Tisiphia endosymbiont of Hybos culiciformis]|uniref:hypothetical protein n=1 Tax=Candidatus Tisiphia endosymbiont of Hybos culiciformis TaxID=3139331 RepID=UPI003CCAC5FE